MLKKLGLITFCAASAFAMHNAELNLNDKDLEFGVKFDMGQYNENIEPENIFVGGKILHASDDHSDLGRGRAIDDLLEANMLVQTKVEGSDSTFGLGVKFNYTQDFSSIPVGLEGRHYIDAIERFPIFIKGLLYYAPEVLSFRDASNYFEYRLEGEVEVMKNAGAFFGYRSIDTNYATGRGGDVNYNSSVYLGLKFAF